MRSMLMRADKMRQVATHSSFRRLALAMVFLCVILIAAEKSNDLAPLLQRLNLLAISREAPIESLFSNSALATNFDRTRRMDPARLAGQFAGAQTLFMHAYDDTPATLATDISAAVADNRDLPPAVRSALLVTEAQATRANQTASAWIDDLVSPAASDCVGVLLLLRQTPGHDPELCWLITRAAPQQGELRLNLVVYGSSADATK